MDSIDKRQAWQVIVDHVFDQVDAPVETRTAVVTPSQVKLIRNAAHAPLMPTPTNQPRAMDPSWLIDSLQRELARLGLELVKRDQ